MRIRARIGACLLIHLAVLRSLFAVQTESVTHDTYADFNKGEPKGVAITDKGLLRLSPEWRVLHETDQPILWAVARDAKGNLYAGGGNEGIVFKIDPNGVATQFFKANEIEVHALAVDPKGNLYVGSSPDGKVYKVAPDGKAEVFFNPGQKYIWAMLFDKDGNLFVATGDKGILYRVPPGGQGAVWYDSDETNLTCLHWDKDGRLLVGTDPSAYIYRIAPPDKKAGETNATAFVVLDATQKEIKSIAASKDGTIFGAALAESGKEGAVIRVDTDGYAEAIWSSKEAAPFSLLWRDEGDLLVGTGDKGMLLSVTPKGETTTLFKCDAAQITALLSVDGGKVVGATSNMGALMEVLPKMAGEGVYDSEVIDSKIFAEWGRIQLAGQTPKGTSVEILSRSGNSSKPEKTWTAWKSVATNLDGGPIQSPNARYLQYRVKLVSEDGSTSPVVDRARLFYMPRNVAPRITVLDVMDAGVGLESITKPPMPQQTSLNTILGIAEKKDEKKELPSGAGPQVRITERPGLRTVVWKAEDANRDELEFAVYYRAEGESNWLLLQDKLKDTFYSWDSTAWADGNYFVRIDASDAADNPPEMGATSSEISKVFTVDNTPPRIDVGQAIVKQAKATVSFKVRDATSRVFGAQYSVGGREWVSAVPDDKVFDSKEESFEVTTGELPKGEHVILIHAADEFGNFSAAKTIVTVP